MGNLLAEHLPGCRTALQVHFLNFEKQFIFFNDLGKCVNIYFTCSTGCNEASRNVKIPVTVPQIGNYKMEFYLLILCDGQSCDEAGTSASISIDGTQEVITVQYTDDATLRQQWVKFSARFKAESTKFDVSHPSSKRLKSKIDDFFLDRLFCLQAGQHRT